MHSRSTRIGCAILAVGTPLRTGRGNDLVSRAGQPLIQRVTLAACRSRVARTAVIVGSRADDVATPVSNLPIDIISNPLWAEGLASSVRSAVGWARGRHFDGLLLALVDGLALSTAHLDALVAASDGALQVVGSSYEGVDGLPALFPRDCYSRLEALAGDVDARAILLDADPDFPVLMLNVPRGTVDEPGDVARRTQPSGPQTPRSPRVVSHGAPEGSRGR
jgi:molybdenum cofactor cytidylyltransferase